MAKAQEVVVKQAMLKVATKLGLEIMIQEQEALLAQTLTVTQRMTNEDTLSRLKKYLADVSPAQPVAAPAQAAAVIEEGEGQ